MTSMLGTRDAGVKVSFDPNIRYRLIDRAAPRAPTMVSTPGSLPGGSAAGSWIAAYGWETWLAPGLSGSLATMKAIRRGQRSALSLHMRKRPYGEQKGPVRSLSVRGVISTMMSFLFGIPLPLANHFAW